MPRNENSREADKEFEHARRVRSMFAGIAYRYDLLNHILSGNTDKRWRRLVAKQLQQGLVVDGARVLDVACGTGDLALALGGTSTTRIVAIDFCRPMLTIAARKSRNNAKIFFVEGDALNLPFADESFDAVSIAFGLRNLASVERGLQELQRVLRPSGSIAILEFSKPLIPGFRELFQLYFTHVLPRIGGFFSGSRGAYEYLPDSVLRFPDQRQLADMMQRAGFEKVSYKNLTGGIAALHLGTRMPGRQVGCDALTLQTQP